MAARRHNAGLPRGHAGGRAICAVYASAAAGSSSSNDELPMASCIARHRPLQGRAIWRPNFPRFCKKIKRKRPRTGEWFTQVCAGQSVGWGDGRERGRRAGAAARDRCAPHAVDVCWCGALPGRCSRGHVAPCAACDGSTTHMHSFGFKRGRTGVKRGAVPCAGRRGSAAPTWPVLGGECNNGDSDAAPCEAHEFEGAPGAPGRAPRQFDRGKG